MPTKLIGLNDDVVYPLPIEELIDPLLVGSLFSVLLFGICLVQATHYLQRADWKRERIDCYTVCAILALSTWLGITQLIYARRMFVEEFGTLRGVANVANNTYLVNILGNVLLTSLCHYWYARRTYRLYKQPLLMGIPLAIIATACLALGLAMVGKLGEIIGGSVNAAGSLNAVNSAVVQKMLVPRYYYTLCCVMDVLLTSAIIGKLLSLRRGFNPATDSVLGRLASVAMATALLTTLSAIFMVAASFPTKIKPTAILVLNNMLPRLFANSLLFSLNSRDSFIAPMLSQATGTSQAHTTSGTSARIIHLAPMQRDSSMQTVSFSELREKEALRQLGAKAGAEAQV